MLSPRLGWLRHSWRYNVTPCVGEVGGAPTPLGIWTLKRVLLFYMFSGKVTDVVDTLNNFEHNLVQCFFCFRAVNLWEKILKDITFLGVTPTVG